MKGKSSVNYGIQANNVQAGAIAVGPHAHATAAAPASERDAAIQKLEEAVRTLQLDDAQQRSLTQHLNAMKIEPASQHASTLDKIVDLLKEAGHAAQLIAPLKGLAAVLGIPLPF